MIIRPLLLWSALVIIGMPVYATDPERIWGTYYGGTGWDEVFSTCVDANGNVYIAGMSWSTDGIAQNGYQNTLGGPGARDAFLAKFSPEGTRLWATYFGGALPEAGYCAVDLNGNVYLGGWTYSPSGIAVNGHQNTFGGTRDAFLAKFDTNGALQWSTYYGGSGDDQGKALFVDNGGNVWLAGLTGSATDIASGGHQNSFGGLQDAFLVKFSPTGTRLWGTYLGGTGTDEGLGLCGDTNGGAYLTGATNSTNAISTVGPAYGGSTDGFVARFSSNGVINWSRYVGGSGSDKVNACAARDGLSVFIGGNTWTTTGMGTNGYQTNYGGSRDGLVARIEASSGTMVWSTYYGGSSFDDILSCAFDGAGRLYVSGTTSSTMSIAGDGFQNTYGGGTDDAFIAKFTTAGERLWGSYYGGEVLDMGYACAVEPGGDVYLAGNTNSTNGIASDGHQMSYAGEGDGFLVRLAGSTATAAVSVRVFLGGAYSGPNMSDGLRAAGLIPANEPYTALGYTHINNSSGAISPGVLLVTGSNAIVDWVVVELRDATNPGTRLITRSALLKRSGEVVDVDGFSALFLDIAPGTYHVAVRHRNHLGVMTAVPVALGQIPTTVNFIAPAVTTYGTNARNMIGSVMVLWPGDANFDGMVRYTGQNNDRDVVLQVVGGITPTNTVAGYFTADANMNGVVSYTGNNNDRDIILQTIGGVVPTAVRLQQLP